MYTINKGIAIIFNHYEYVEDRETPREGCQYDTQQLTCIFNKLKIDSTVHVDKTLENIKKILHNVSVEDHADTDCLVIVVLTHGGKIDGTEFLSANDELYHPSLLWLPFGEKECPTLAGKPKIVIIQSCRGPENIQNVKAITTDGFKDKKPPEELLNSTQKNMNKISTMKNKDKIHLPEIQMYNMPDLLVARSTFIGYKSKRSPDKGCIYIDDLMSNIEENTTDDIITVLTRVNRLISLQTTENNDKSIDDSDESDEILQIPCFSSSLTKILRLIQ